tara:strand:+ start:776 stop:1231 length:456 start_codon:yes stop_codon:yes gene_type:complete
MWAREISEQIADKLVLEIHECVEIRMMWEIGSPALKKTDGTVLWKPDIGIETEFRTADSLLQLIGHFSDPETRNLYIALIQIGLIDLKLRWAPIPWQPDDDRWTRPESSFSEWLPLNEAQEMQRILISSGSHVAADEKDTSSHRSESDLGD